MEELNVFREKRNGGICIICGEAKQQGIRIISQFLCQDCEREIVATDVQDEKYSYYVARMKQIWLEAIS
ncbi:sigma factor G inhibitor Gin [Tumebacillus lipolyticus]|uniref:Sigma factor G inhibitor Gin n=1 Tax=Tumebacillus lipolyticus TaxID=1280370 RepID=A0ABW4ZZX9_9BACL